MLAVVAAGVGFGGGGPLRGVLLLELAGLNSALSDAGLPALQLVFGGMGPEVVQAPSY